MNLFLYLLTVIIWGTTWIAIKLQLGVVAIPVSIFYRFALAGLVLFAGLLLLGKLQKLDRRGHLMPGTGPVPVLPEFPVLLHRHPMDPR